MAVPRDHLVKKYSTLVSVEGSKVKTTLYMLSCSTCRVFGQGFNSRAARDAAAKLHK